MVTALTLPLCVSHWHPTGMQPLHRRHCMLLLQAEPLAATYTKLHIRSLAQVPVPLESYVWVGWQQWPCRFAQTRPDSGNAARTFSGQHTHVTCQSCPLFADCGPSGMQDLTHLALLSWHWKTLCLQVSTHCTFQSCPWFAGPSGWRALLHQALLPWHDDFLRVQESEGEEAAESRVTLPQDLGHGNLAARQSRIRLHEVIIPRRPG